MTMADVSAGDLAVARRKDRNVYILLGGPLTFGAAGLANSVVLRANAMATAGWRVTILVDVWQPDLEKQVTLLKEGDDLEVSVCVANVFDDLSSMFSDEETTPDRNRPGPVVGDYTSGMMAELDTSNERVVRYFRDGDYRYFGWMDDAGNIRFLDELVDGNRTRRLHFSECQYLSRLTVYQSGNVPLYDEYFAHDGTMYLRQPGELSSADKETLLLTAGKRYSSYRDTNCVLLPWLEDWLRLQQSDILISEYAFKFDVLQNVKRRTGVRVIYTLHSSHLAHPHRFGSPIKPELRDTLGRIPAMDALVVLTPQQRFDIQKCFPHVGNIYVVSHAAPRRSTVNSVPVMERDPHLIVSVGRLTASKGHEALIRSFDRVLAQDPNAVLEIWGRGENETDLRNLISELGLSRNVKLCGFIPDPTPIYQRASVALFPTLLEGQSLVLMESMQQGCVPVSFDFKYGARMLVSDLMNGILVDHEDIDDLVVSAGHILSDSVMLNSLSQNAIATTDQYTPSKMLDQWESVFDECDASFGGR